MSAVDPVWMPPFPSLTGDPAAAPLRKAVKIVILNVNGTVPHAPCFGTTEQGSSINAVSRKAAKVFYQKNINLIDEIRYFQDSRIEYFSFAFFAALREI
jgi:hypothetical protein